MQNVRLQSHAPYRVILQNHRLMSSCVFVFKSEYIHLKMDAILGQKYYIYSFLNAKTSQSKAKHHIKGPDCVMDCMCYLLSEHFRGRIEYNSFNIYIFILYRFLKSNQLYNYNINISRMKKKKVFFHDFYLEILKLPFLMVWLSFTYHFRLVFLWCTTISLCSRNIIVFVKRDKIKIYLAIFSEYCQIF